MHVIANPSYAFIRIDPGEQLVASLREFSLDKSIGFGAILSGVGMLTDIELGFYQTSKRDYEKQKFEGVFDLSNVSGNIALRDGLYAPHIHIVANRTDYSTISGHLIEATCHITIELLVAILPSFKIERVSETGRHATFLRGRE